MVSRMLYDVYAKLYVQGDMFGKVIIMLATLTAIRANGRCTGVHADDVLETFQQLIDGEDRPRLRADKRDLRITFVADGKDLKSEWNDQRPDSFVVNEGRETRRRTVVSLQVIGLARRTVPRSRSR